MESFYRAFEDRFRGTKESVKNRLKFYLNLVKNIDNNKMVVDLGCGRGEFIELLNENGYKNVIGVDIDDNMADRKKSYILIKDALDFLKESKDKSIGMISSFHMIEHIQFDKFLHLIKEVYRVLDDKGIFIVETPNPENIKVSCENFYLDPTHKRVLPMELVKFCFEYVGFEARVLRRSYHKFDNSIKSVIENVSPDYAVVGYKDSSMIDESFFEGGISLDLAEFAFEERIKYIEKSLMDTLIRESELKDEIKSIKDELKNEIRNIKNEFKDELKNEIKSIKDEFKRLENENSHYKNLYQEIVNSKSWKLTKPLRKFMSFLKNRKRDVILKHTLKEDEKIELSQRAEEIYKNLKEEIKQNDTY